MTSPAEILSDRDGSVGWIRINRPQRLNAFSPTMRQELGDALQAFDGDPEVRCIIVTGVGRAFCTGGDVKVMEQLIADDDVDGFEAMVRAGARVVQLIEDMTTPVIAAINGPAAGAGACLALACDLRVASEAATIGFGFLRVGLHPDWGGSYFLPHLVGYARAAEFFYTGEMVSAERAEQLGLVNRVVPANELEATARTLAGQIANGPTSLVLEVKRTLRQGMRGSLDAILEAETQAQLRAFRSADFREGINAFIEKRAPKFGRRQNGAHGREGPA